jgi:hypothetical protein
VADPRRRSHQRLPGAEESRLLHDRHQPETTGRV